MGQGGKGSRKHAEPGESGHDSKINEESRQLLKKKCRYSAVGKGHIKKKLPPAPKSNTFVDTKDENDNN